MVHECRSGQPMSIPGPLLGLCLPWASRCPFRGERSLSYDEGPASFASRDCWLICLELSVSGFGYLGIQDSNMTQSDNKRTDGKENTNSAIYRKLTTLFSKNFDE